MEHVFQKEVQYTNDYGEHYLTITRYQQYVYAKWKGHVSTKEVITAATAFLEDLRQHHCPRLLNDKSEVTGDWQEANDWLEYDWLPKAYEAGLRCIAHIYSLSMFSQLAAIDLRQRISPPLKMKNFTEFDSAFTWIQNCRTEDEQAPLPEL